MCAQVSKEVTTVQVTGVTFGFFTDAEIRKLSVKRITSPLVYDNLKNAVPNGLYDAAMGPMETHDSCTTCGLRYQHCPGHFGHVELAVPVFNPLVFPMMFKLLRCTCLHCFHLKMDLNMLARFRQRLALLLQGRLVEATGVVGGASSAVRSAADKIGKEEGAADMEEDAGPKSGAWGTAAPGLDMSGSKGKSAAEEGPVLRAGKLTAGTLEAVRDCIAEMMKQMPLKQCANCKASNPTIRREGASKVFQMPLTPAQIARNAVLGTILRPITINPSDAASGEAAGLEQELATQLAAGGKAGDAAAAQASVKQAGRPCFMTPAEVREALRRMWARHGDLLSLIFATDAQRSGLALPGGVGGAADSWRMFFLHAVAVPPNKFRPPSRMGDGLFEHPQNTVLGQVVTTNLELEALAAEPAYGSAVGDKGAGASAADIAAARLGRSLKLWLDLQASVNGFIDSTTADKGVLGIRQQLEKKEGLFRKNMMGKRVNFACRSVISPDPYIATGEIGVPPYFAKRLSFPEPVTPWNAAALAAAVRAGPDALPGAVAVEDEQGRMLSLATLASEKRDAIAKQLLARASAAAAKPGKGKTVYRNLRDGDLMLTNRQPTLHKPGMMAHRARVLKGERTIRMHYANCATFNADFDGDEINLHLPQDQMGRAEGYGIVHADEQYIVPTDGKPIRGLIQDHIVAGVLLTKRDTFLTRAQYMQLLYAACCSSRPGADAAAAVGSLAVPPPAIWHPQPLYTGKQVLSAVVRHFTRGMAPVSMVCKAKTPAHAWGNTSSEEYMEFRSGDMVTGLLDKAQFGSYGLVHSVQELYGNVVAGRLLSGFSRLFTHFLQGNGFTCGIDDVILNPEAEAKRATVLKGADATALRASAEAASLPPLKGGEDDADEHSQAVVQAALAKKYAGSREWGAMHDASTMSAINPFASTIVGACFPGGEKKPFRHNCMALMTSTGAKGSQVNFSQISCLLGQQTLEGRRVPRMSSGKTLPCFAPYDGGARSGGFVGDRFLDGLRPQEYYFHCMAGREGLVDTTVKTSRSGYLQRCMVKNLEALHVHYDATVRDDTDGSIVQFLYGEDGVDVLQTGFLTKFSFQASNADRFAQQLRLREAQAAAGAVVVRQQETALQQAARERQRLRREACRGKDAAAAVLAAEAGRPPFSATAPPSALGAVSEAFADSLADYLEENPDKLLKDKGRKRKAIEPEDADGAADGEVDPRSGDGFRRLMELKYARAAAVSGEAVGVLAAQSIGEPSTQMTLNTFHMAGRGEANVTLGIPRLRELLMTAALSIKTPVMTLPLLPPLPDPQRRSPVDSLSKREKAAVLQNRLRRLSFAEILKGISIQEQLDARTPVRRYTVLTRIYPMEKYPAEAGLTFSMIEAAFQNGFVPRLRAAVKAAQKRADASFTVDTVNVARVGGEEGAGGPAFGGAAQRDDGEGAQGAKASKKEDEDENAEADADMEEGKLQWVGGRKEEATYDAGEAEDMAIQRANEPPEVDEDEDDGEEEPPGESTMDGDTPSASPAQGTAQQQQQQPIDTQNLKPAVFKAKGQAATAGAVFNEVVIDEGRGTLALKLNMSLAAPKVLLLELAERAAVATTVCATPGIERSNIVEPPGSNGPIVEAQGISFPGVWQHQDLIDTARITTNDVGAVLQSLGVEAARSTLLTEIGRVFGVYGIGVDARHLNLIADFMMHQGGYRACSRLGIDSNASPFLKISFETATAFLTEATLRGAHDDLSSPAARLVLGRVVESGTGGFGLVQQLPSVPKQQSPHGAHVQAIAV